MKTINRRHFLKLSSLVGAGSLVGGLPLWKAGGTSRSYFLVTDNPVRDVRNLIKSMDLGFDGEFKVELLPIQPTGQDLGIIENGRLIDPTRTHRLAKGLRDLAHDLRSRKTSGQYLVTVEKRRPRAESAITLEVNGQTVDQISPEKNYSQIVVRGELGKVVFKLQDSRLSVVETSCRNTTCKKIGAIRFGRIICAPNKLVATINTSCAGVDGITG